MTEDQLPTTFEQIAEWDRTRPGWWRTADTTRATPRIAAIIRGRRASSAGDPGADSTH